MIKGKLLLSSYDQLWAVQYGEIGRWSLVEAKTGNSLNIIHIFSLQWVGRIKVKIFGPERVKRLGAFLQHIYCNLFWLRIYRHLWKTARLAMSAKTMCLLHISIKLQLLWKDYCNLDQETNNSNCHLIVCHLCPIQAAIDYFLVS